MNKLSGSEAIFGFSAWLTTRKEQTVMGCGSDCAPIPPLIDEFCKANNLDEVREHWEKDLTHPPAKIGVVCRVAKKLRPIMFWQEKITITENG